MLKKKDFVFTFFIFILVTALALTGLFVLDRYSRYSLIYANKLPYKVGATYMTLNNPFFEVVDDEIRSSLEAQGDTLITLDPALSLEAQKDQIHYLIEQDVDAIIVNPVNYEGLQSALVAARKAGIPVFTVDTQVEDETLVTYNIVSDNYDAGVQCAKDMMAHLESANIVLLEHSSTNSGKERIQGFLDTISNKDQYHIVHRIECEGQLEISMPLMEEYLAQNPQIDVVMALNDPSALGALAALQAYGQFEGVLVYGVDGTPETKQMIHDGRMQATVAQSPITMGSKVAQAVEDVLHGGKVKSSEVVPVSLITQDNIDEYSLEGWQ